MTQPAIAAQARGLSVTFGRQAVLRGVDVDLWEGQSVALVGTNGAGKTTLLRALAGVLVPTAGEVRWFGSPLRRRPAVRKLAGLVAHESILYPHLTLRENLRFAARMCGAPGAAAVADRWLARVGLSAWSHRTPAQVSRGMRQRVAIARALVHEPRIVLLDEPFSSLDAEGTAWLDGLLGELRSQGRTVCFVTHDLLRARRTADRVLRVGEGRVVEEASRYARAA